MIKVIGKRDPKAVKRTTCGNCAAILEYTQADTRTFDKKDYTGDSSTYRVLDCPECKEAITLEVT